VRHFSACPPRHKRGIHPLDIDDQTACWTRLDIAALVEVPPIVVTMNVVADYGLLGGHCVGIFAREVSTSFSIGTSAECPKWTGIASTERQIWRGLDVLGRDIGDIR
jgi:hypothetical protein